MYHKVLIFLEIVDFIYTLYPVYFDILNILNEDYSWGVWTEPTRLSPSVSSISNLFRGSHIQKSKKKTHQIPYFQIFSCEKSTFKTTIILKYLLNICSFAKL